MMITALVVMAADELGRCGDQRHICLICVRRMTEKGVSCSSFAACESTCGSLVEAKTNNSENVNMLSKCGVVVTACLGMSTHSCVPLP